MTVAWLSGWGSCKKIVLTAGYSGKRIDYQLKMLVVHARDMNNDFSDIRFTDSDGKTVLDAWLQEKTDGVSAVVWVEIPTTPEVGETRNLCMYYGNPDASEIWNGKNTFLSYRGYADDEFFVSSSISPIDISYEAKVKRVGSSQLRFGLSESIAFTQDSFMIVTKTTADTRSLWAINTPGTTELVESPNIPDDTWVKLLITYDGTTLYGYIDNNEIDSGGITTNIPDESVGMGIHVDSGAVIQEYSFTTKYVKYPPTYVFGDAEHDPTAILHRLKNRFTTPYYTDDGGNIDKLMQVVSSPVAELSNTTDDIIAAHQLSEATGHSLDLWGNLLQVVRDTGETDAHYRARLLSYSVMYSRSATPQQMVSSCADVLGVESSHIVLSDSSSPATFSMTVFLSDIEDAGLSLPEYVSIMNVVKAGGVLLSLLSAGSFECKAIAGAHDLYKGYNNIADANPDGGLYAGLIGVV